MIRFHIYLLRALRTARIALARCVFGLPCAILISLGWYDVSGLFAFLTLYHIKRYFLILL